MNNPLVSFCILAYNQENYIIEALNGAVSQDYDNMEIIVSDDDSTDSTAQKIIDFVKGYHGRHRLVYNVNEHNLGIAAHLNRVISISNGDFLILAGGDDISLPSRTKKSVSLLLSSDKDIGAMGFEYIDECSKYIIGKSAVRAEHDCVYTREDYLNSKVLLASGPSKIIRRSLIDKFGPLQESCPTEDTPFVLRSILTGGVAFSHAIGVKYRIHRNNVSSEKSLLTVIDSDRIYSQYNADLEKAKSLQIITDEEYRIINQRIGYYQIIESTKRKFYNSKSIKKRLLATCSFLSNRFVKFNINSVKTIIHMCRVY